VLLAVIFIFTWLPLIHQKMIANNNDIGNNTVQQHIFSFNELSHIVLAMVANMTGHTGERIFLICFVIHMIAFAFKHKSRSLVNWKQTT